MATANGTTTGGKGPLAQAPDQVQLRPPRARLTSEYVADPAGYAFGDWLRAAPPYVDARTRQFGAAAYEDMLYDETVSASLRALVLGVLSDDIFLRPAVDNADDPLYEQSKEVLSEVEDDLNALGKPLVETTHAALLAALAAGSKPGELVFRDEDDNGGRLALDRLNLKSRKSVAYVCDAYGNLRGYLAVLPGLGAVQTVTSFSASDPPHNFLPREKFAQWTFDSEDNDPRGRPLLRCVYDAWYNGKIQAAREWLMHLARFGSPTLVGTTPQESEAAALADEAGNPIDPNSVPSPEQVFLNRIIQVRNGGSIVLPWGGTLTALQVANAGDSFFKRIDYADRQISRGILLAVRAVMESKFGSKADSQTAQDVTGLFTRYLKTWCAGVLTRDVIRPMVLYNRGEEAARTLAPYASLSPVEHQDWGTELVAASTAYKAGVIREDQLPSVWERMGLPASTLPAPPPPQPPPQPGTPPGPGNGPGTPPSGRPAPKPPAPPQGNGARAPARQKAAAAFSWDEAKHPRDEIGRFAAAAGAEARRHYEQSLDKPRGERRAFLKERLATVYKALKRSIAAYAGKRFDLALNRLAEQTGLARATFEPLRAGLPDLVDLLASRYRENLNDLRSGKYSGYYGSKDPGDVAEHFRDKFGPPEAHRGDLIDSFGSAAEKIVDDFRNAEADRLGVPDADKDYEGYEKGMEPVEARAAQLHQAIADVLAFTFDPHRPGEKYESVSFAREDAPPPAG